MGETVYIPQVVLGWIHDGFHVAPAFTECYAELRLVDSHLRRLIDANERPLIATGHYLHKNRNLVAKRFLFERKEPWLMFLDTDMLFSVAQFYQLYDQAAKIGPGIHAGLYYTIFGMEGGHVEGGPVQVPHGVMDIRSTWAKIRPTDIEFISERRLAVRDDLDGVGMGFTLIHRKVIAALAAIRPKHLEAWFGHDEIIDAVSGEIGTQGEDYCFCLRAKQAGFKVYGHDNICLGHAKQAIITWETFDREQAVLEIARQRDTGKLSEMEVKMI